MSIEPTERVVYVYALVDPRDGRTRYIGQSDRPVARLRGHYKDVARGSQSKKCIWLRELKEAGLKPSIEILLEGDESAVNEFEAATIQLFMGRYDDLTNSNTAVGANRRGETHDEKTRALLSELATRQMADPAMRALLSELAKLRPPPSAETRVKLATMKGKTHTPEARAKISAANKGKPKPESVKRAVAESNRRRAGTPLSDAHKENLRTALEASWDRRHAQKLGVEIHVMVH